MADRGRDLKIGIVSDVDRFDLDAPADELEQLGSTAEDAGRSVDDAREELRRLAAQGEDAARELAQLDRAVDGVELDKLGTDAKDTARKVRGAFEDIAAGAKSNLKKTDDQLDRAGDGLRDFKDEAAGSGREAAASFGGGFDDITSLVQETAANAFGGFGPLGAAAGIAAAAGIGIITNKINEAKERMKELVQLFTDIGRDAGAPDRIRAVLEELDPGKLDDIRDALDRTGLDARTFFDAISSGDAGKLADVRRQLEGMIPTINAPWDTKATEAQHLIHVLGDYGDASAEAQANTALWNDVLGETPAKADAVATSVDNAAAAHDEFKSSVEGSLEEVNGSWTDSVKSVKASLTDYQAALDEQTRAVTAHKNNLLAVQRQGDDEFTAWVAEQPATVAAAYAKGTAAQRQSFYASWKRNVGAAAAEGITDGLVAGSPAVETAARSVHAKAKAILEDRVYIPASVAEVSRAQLAEQRAAVQAWLDAHPNVVRIRAEIDSYRNP
jgi:ABC-type transporter Mla subunit MlaD